jgi:hypothetical protein
LTPEEVAVLGAIVLSVLQVVQTVALAYIASRSRRVRAGDRAEGK